MVRSLKVVPLCVFEKGTCTCTWWRGGSFNLVSYCTTFLHSIIHVHVHVCIIHVLYKHTHIQCTHKHKHTHTQTHTHTHTHTYTRTHTHTQHLPNMWGSSWRRSAKEVVSPNVRLWEMEAPRATPSASMCRVSANMRSRKGELLQCPPPWE